MQEISFAVQYYLFMKWFKQNYPELYNRNCMHIRVPEHNNMIYAVMDFIDPADRESLREVIKEFYSLVD